MRKFKKILVFPDFCSSGIWDGSEKHHCMIDYEDLGLPKKLIKEFKHWVNDMYDAGYRHRNYDGLRKKAVMPVYREGLRLAGEIKKLFPKTEVEYWGELYRCELKKVKINRGFGSLRSTVKIDGTLADPTASAIHGNGVTKPDSAHKMEPATIKQTLNRVQRRALKIK